MLVRERHKLGFPVLFLSVLAAVALTALWVPLQRHKVDAHTEPGTASRSEIQTQLKSFTRPLEIDELSNVYPPDTNHNYSNTVKIQSNEADLKKVLLEKRLRAAPFNRTFQNGPLAAPPNDLCSGAEVIPGNGPFPVFTGVTADITDATITGDPPVPSCQTVVSRSIWYSFTPSLTGTYDISSCAAAGTGTTVDDTVIAVYTSSNGACNGVFTEVPGACDDDSCITEALQSVVSNIKLTSGTTYFIVVWQFDVPPPTSGNTAVQLRINRIPPPVNDTCSGATTLSLNAPAAGTTIGAFNDYQLTGSTCFTGIGQTASTATGREVVYSFTAPTTDTYSFKVKNYNVPGNLVLYASNTCPAALPAPQNLTCNNLSGPVVAGANRASSNSSEEVMCLPMTSGQQIFLFVDDNLAETSFAGSQFTIEASVCLSETEPNNTPATANSLGPQSFGIEGSTNPAGDVDFYSLGSLNAGDRVFSMIDAAASNSTDFDLRVTTAVDTLEYDDLNADTLFGSLAPVIGGTPITASGPVFLRVSHFSAAQTAQPYRLYYSVQPGGTNPLPACVAMTTSATAESEPNNTTAQANSALNNYFSGSLSGPAPSTDVDVFSFTAFAGQVVFIDLDGDPCRNNSPIDGKLELLAPGGTNVIATVNDGGSTSNTTSGAGSLTSTTPNSPAEGIVLRIPASGTYFARVSIGTSSAGSIGSGDYLLSITTVTPSAANGTVNGRITTTNGQPLPGAVVGLDGTQMRKTITDENGNYHFDGIETGGFYTVTPLRANFSFVPASRSFSQLSERTEAAFVASMSGDAVNPVDTAEYFVRQQYVDVLGREPDEGGFNYWSDQILNCGANAACMNNRRQEVSAAFFIEDEFQRTGSYLYGMYKAALGRQPLYEEFSRDRQHVVDGPNVELLKQLFAQTFVSRPEFVVRYQNYLTADTFVDAVIRNVQLTSGIDLSADRALFTSRYNSGASLSDSRGRALRSISESNAFRQVEYNPAFVLTEYFAYLRRDPDTAGFEFWLDVLNNRVPGNYRSMVCAFITSTEYQRRFSTIISRSNRDCGQ